MSLLKLYIFLFFVHHFISVSDPFDRSDCIDVRSVFCVPLSVVVGVGSNCECKITDLCVEH